MKVLWILLTLFVSNLAQAEVKVHLVLVKGPYALSKAAANSVMATALAEYKGIKKPIRFYKVTEIDDPTPELNLLSKKYTKYYLLKKFAQSKHWLKKGTLVHFITPPKIEANGIRYIDGLADFCTYKAGGVSSSGGQDFNQYGLNRIYWSAVTLMHEVGHGRCANHDNSSPNIMHATALAYADQGIHFNKKAIKEIKG